MTDTFNSLAKAGMKLEDMFEKVPIVMSRAHLLQQFLAQEYPVQDLHINSQILKLFPEKYAVNHLYPSRHES